jgi:hypothetical protein
VFDGTEGTTGPTGTATRSCGLSNNSESADAMAAVKSGDDIRVPISEGRRVCIERGGAREPCLKAKLPTVGAMMGTCDVRARPGDSGDGTKEGVNAELLGIGADAEVLGNCAAVIMEGDDVT